MGVRVSSLKNCINDESKNIVTKRIYKKYKIFVSSVSPFFLFFSFLFCCEKCVESSYSSCNLQNGPQQEVGHSRVFLEVRSEEGEYLLRFCSVLSASASC